jgi:hypothetical protein
MSKWSTGDSLLGYKDIPDAPDIFKNADGDTLRSFARLHEMGADMMYDQSLLADDAKRVNDYLCDQMNVEKSFPSSTTLSPRDLMGFQQAGSVLRRLYPNPFQVAAFVSENYWAAWKSRRELWKEVDRDGFVLKSESKQNPKRLREALDYLDNLSTNGRDAKYFINKIRDTIATFGNMVAYPERKKGQDKLFLFVMENLQPVINREKDEIVRWEYYLQHGQSSFSPDQVDHVYTYSCRTNVMGTPALSPVIVDVEAAMHSSIYQNTVMQKGGMMRGLLALRSLNSEKQVVNDKSYMDLAEQLTKFYDRRFGGVRGAGQLAVAPFLEKFYDLNKVGEMDMAYKNLNEIIGIRTATMFGVNPERIGLSRGSQYKNEAEVFDSISLSFDNEMYYTSGLTFDYLNKKLAEAGFDGIYLSARGEFGAISKAAAMFALAIAQTKTKIITVNEFRTRVMRWESLDGPEGDAYIGDMNTQSDVAKAIGKPTKSMIKRYNDDLEVRIWTPEELKWYR